MHARMGWRLCFAFSLLTVCDICARMDECISTYSAGNARFYLTLCANMRLLSYNTSNPPFIHLIERTTLPQQQVLHWQVALGNVEEVLRVRLIWGRTRHVLCAW